MSKRIFIRSAVAVSYTRQRVRYADVQRSQIHNPNFLMG
jgi:hypothetical protein